MASTTDPIESLIAKIAAGKNAAIGFLPGSSPSWLAAYIRRRVKRPVLVLVQDREKASQVSKELMLFCPEPPVLFPALDYYRPEGTESSGERSAVLAMVLKNEAGVVVAPAPAIFQPCLAPEFMKKYLFELSPGQKIEREFLLGSLLESGYQVSAAVSEPGEFSVRGGIIDIFPPGAKSPGRIEFFGNEIESIRLFDPADQRSCEKTGRCLVWPAREMVLNKELGPLLKQALFRLAEDLKKEQLPGQAVSFTPALRELTEKIDQLQHFYIEERFLPLLDKSWSLLDYLSEQWLVVIVDEMAVNQSLAALSKKSDEDWHRLVSGGSLLPSPEQIYIPQDQANQKLSKFQTLSLGISLKGAEEGGPGPGLDLKIETGRVKELQVAIELNPDLSFSPKLPEPISKFLEEIRKLLAENFSVVLVSSSLSQAERLGEMLREHEVYPAELSGKDEFFDAKWPLAIAVGDLHCGFKVTEFGLVLISEREVFGEKIKKPLLKPSGLDWHEEDLSDLAPGELIVHFSHGIGIYRGMTPVRFASFEKWDYLKDRKRPSQSQPCLEIEYDDGARLYLPVDQINLIQKYRNPGEGRPKLDRLGSKSFEQAKQKAEESIEKLAQELIELYAAREVFPGAAYPAPDHTYREFEAGFEYEETPDQEKAITDVIADLSQPRPMDRLVLGDVGYGKTEVGLRASWLVAMQGKQVALLCPTTILAQQHYDNFQRRLSGWPLKLCMLSRFQTRAEQKKNLEELTTGLCDIAIGTHRLLSKDVRFKELGLLIIDEEQRFGVVQKEKIRQLKKTVDCLTLSATPIPRTLQMSMLGLRDLSMINTPPQDRQAIHTELVHFDQQLIREAVLREIERKGQVFFVHNRVQGIDQVGNLLARLVPEARIAVAHGQMNEHRLEKVMHDFYNHKYDVLVSTAIIESGLDLPSANTIIINRADQFGLAQLYQLRGRIGRSRERGYAYLVVPSRAEVKGDAVKRLKALKEFTELGSGFKLAAYDLKIRGAGNLLGREQSGQISRIGYELYLRLLENKIKELKGVKPEEIFEPRIKLALPAFLPEDYVPGDSERLGWYKRLAMANDQEMLDALRGELMDRYGKLPDPAQNLLKAVKLKFRMRELRIPEIEADDNSAVISFDDTSRVDFGRVIDLAKDQPDRFRFTRDQSLVYSVRENGLLFQELEGLFKGIQEHRE